MTYENAQNYKANQSVASLTIEQPWAFTQHTELHSYTGFYGLAATFKNISLISSRSLGNRGKNKTVGWLVVLGLTAL